jgi:hypothetical protein
MRPGLTRDAGRPSLVLKWTLVAKRMVVVYECIRDDKVRPQLYGVPSSAIWHYTHGRAQAFVLTAMASRQVSPLKCF